VPTVLKSGSLNLLKPSELVQACNGIPLPFLHGNNEVQQTDKVEPAVVQHSTFKVEMAIEILKSYKSRENGQIQAHLIQAEVKQYDPWSINLLILF
jgi:hypothetical protein